LRAVENKHEASRAEDSLRNLGGRTGGNKRSADKTQITCAEAEFACTVRKFSRSVVEITVQLPNSI